MMTMIEGWYTNNSGIDFTILTKPNYMSWISEDIEECVEDLDQHRWDNGGDYTILLVPLEMM